MTLELWAGAECSMICVGDRYVDQLALTGHETREGDLARLASLGVTAVRFPVVWERCAPAASAPPDLRFADRGLAACKDLGLRPIVGLVHHGSGPRTTRLTDPAFVTGLAAWARVVAERYPWVTDWTPVNEPGTTARFSGLYGHWYPHERSARVYVEALLVEVLATRAAMRAIREVVPGARLVQTEDLGTVWATPRLAYQAAHENERRFLSLDLLAGRVGDDHPLRRWLEGEGAPRDVLEDLARDPCPPDVVGVNYYLTSDRWLDDDLARYPPHLHGGNARDRYVDVEAVRVRPEGICGHEALLRAVWERYRLPTALTEVHLGCTNEEQVRWLVEAWDGASRLRREGADIRALTLWSAFGAVDWSSLCTEARGHYEPGAFDVRGGVVRETALARVARELGRQGTTTHPAARVPGWWRRAERIHFPRSATPTSPATGDVRPVLVVGARGTLGRALVHALEARRVPYVATTRSELDASDARAVDAAFARFEPWAVVNAAGDVRVDAAEQDPARCLLENVTVAATLAGGCARAGIPLVTFSTDLVFDGTKGGPYVESDAPLPRNVYGEAKARAEAIVRDACPGALVVRTAAFFGPWDAFNFVRTTLDALARGEVVRAAHDGVVSPTYVPDLAHATLTLLVDGAEGVFHLANVGEVSWVDLARRVASAAGHPEARVVARRFEELGVAASRPANVALASERAALMPSLDDALARFFDLETQRLARAAE